MSEVYNIIEVANVHQGKPEYVEALMDEFRGVKGIQGIKFQPFKYDRIALPDFSWYPVYQELFFTKSQWKALIEKAHALFDVWIDTFDGYTVEVIEENLDKIRGLKFQSSTLFNNRLLNELSRINLSGKQIIINVSGIELGEIQDVIDRFQRLLSPEEIFLQVGFQGYPTEMKDNGLNKIQILKSSFGNRISFADHIDAESEDAILLPVFAALQGATIIEKHIKLSGAQPKYDYYSSLDREKYGKYLESLARYYELLNQPFLNEKEKVYLQTTIQVPTVNRDVAAFATLDIDSDFEFKRTGQEGMRSTDLAENLRSFHILAKSKKIGETIQPEDLKKANIATIIACRLKSSRLPKKAVLKIGELSSVEYCVRNALKFRNVSHTILATSTAEEDAELSHFTYSPQVIFHRGHPIDVIDRYLHIINELKIDVFVRVTADMPFISDDILQPILRSHFAAGADYSRARHAAIGTNLEVISAQALRKVKSFFPSADYSEYMTYYFTNNPQHFRINEIELSPELVRDFRLTLDYQEDLDLFNKIEDHFKEKKVERSLKNVFSFLDAHPEVSSINRGLEVKYHTDKELIGRIRAHTTIVAQ